MKATTKRIILLEGVTLCVMASNAMVIHAAEGLGDDMGAAVWRGALLGGMVTWTMVVGHALIEGRPRSCRTIGCRVSHRPSCPRASRPAVCERWGCNAQARTGHNFCAEHQP